MLLRENRPREAEAVLQEAIDLDPELAAAHKNLGLAAAAAGRFQEAVEHVRRAIVLSPNTVSFHYSLASVLREAGRREEAEVELHRILERWPSHPGAERALAALGGSR
jgi:Flp pilus assembly protein TadD